MTKNCLCISLYTCISCNFLILDIGGGSTQHERYKCVNSWLRLDQLICLQFPAVKDLNLRLRKSHDTQEYIVYLNY